MDNHSPAASAPTAPAVPRGVVDLLCPTGHVVAETLDRRWLWALHETLTRRQPDGSELPGRVTSLAAALRTHLDETCEHHWEQPEDGPRPDGGLWCLWCQVEQPPAQA